MAPARVLLAALLVVANGCSRRVTPVAPALPAGEAARVAVLPFEPGVIDDKGRFAPLAAVEGVGPEVGPDVARRLSADLSAAGVAVVDPDRVAGAASLGASGSFDPAFAASVARKVGANLAVLGAVSLYQQRDGSAWGATRPAGVDYQTLLVRADGATTAAQVRFAYTQQALSENLLDLPKFVQGGGRWMTREEILDGALRETAGKLATVVHANPARAAR
jgi:hypothetical protein